MVLIVKYLIFILVQVIDITSWLEFPSEKEENVRPLSVNDVTVVYNELSRSYCHGKLKALVPAYGAIDLRRIQ